MFSINDANAFFSQLEIACADFDDFVCGSRVLARDAFVCLSVCLSMMGVHCDHTVHVSADLSLWLDSALFWTPRHQSMSTYFQTSFPVPPEIEVWYGCAN